MKLVRLIVISIIGIAALGGNTSFAQIIIPNASFEENIAFGAKIFNWDSCGGYAPPVAVCTPYPKQGFSILSPPIPPDGNNYCDLDADGYVPSTFSFITAKLSCPVIKGLMHHFSIWAIGCNDHFVAFHGLGYFTIHLGHNACDSAQRVYTSIIMPDTLYWRKYEIDFMPDDNYEYIGLQGHNPPNTNQESNTLVDNFSPITVEVTGKAKINITGLQQTNCYNMDVAIANNINLIRYQWKMNGSIFSTAASLSNLCINQATTIYFTGWDACGYAYVDSLNINRNELIVEPTTANNINLRITPFSEPLQLSLFNDLGQMISTETISEQTTTATIHTETLPKGVYFITLYNTHVLIKRKWMKVNY